MVSLLLLSYGVIFTIFILRTAFVLYQINFCPGPLNIKAKSAKTMIVLGSGGHTTEMFKLLSTLNFEKYYPRIYVVTYSDPLSQGKVAEFEKGDGYAVEKVPRSRKVGQSYFTSVFTFLWACVGSCRIVVHHLPDVILCNGPGICLPLILFMLLLRVFSLKQNRIVYVESFCRVKTLSLTGKILYRLVDDFVVNWKELSHMYPRAIYVGRLF
ncbi:ALG14, UDP-N-acetylglucosaminyltransferase subunit [Oratosquilla oratoria]|uniref:ALG14, UDP-N-acetylglucosaminyltransferase subunit n=1 Tax=Oratosquilla oratoria TaxID=337810 RepID=UPI003F75B3A1